MQELVMAVMTLGIVIASFLFVGWMIWMVSRSQKERQQNEMELRARMLDKFGSSEEFVGFMQTDGGKRFLEVGKTKAEKSSRRRVASSLSWAVVVGMFGLALFVIGLFEGDTDTVTPGTVFLAVAIGLALTAYIYHRLAPDAPNGDN